MPSLNRRDLLENPAALAEIFPSLAALVPVRNRLAATQGAGLRLLTATCMSPSLGAAIDRVLQRYPEARWHQSSTVSRDRVRAGALRAYASPLVMVPRAAAADVILGLESGIADGAPGWVRYARDIAGRRNPVLGPPNRIFAVESVPTALGAIADQRIPAGPADLHAAITGLAGAILRNAVPSGPEWLAPIASALKAANGRALIHAGPDLPAESQAMIFAMNEALGGGGHTYDLLQPPEYRPEDTAASLAALEADMQAGRVETLLMLDVVPAFTRPASRTRCSVSPSATPAPLRTKPPSPPPGMFPLPSSSSAGATCAPMTARSPSSSHKQSRSTAAETRSLCSAL